MSTQMITTRQTVEKHEQLRDARGAAGELDRAEKQAEMVATLRAQGVAVRDVVLLAKMVLREHLSVEAIEEIGRAAEYVQDVQRQLKATHEEMKLMLRGAVVLGGQLGGDGLTPAVMLELAGRILASPKKPGPVVPEELAAAETCVRACLRPEEVVRVVLAPGPGLPWNEPVAEQLAVLRSRRRGSVDEVVVSRAVLVWLLRNQTMLSFPEICMITRGRRSGHSTCVTQMHWLANHWDALPAAPWRTWYRSHRDLACELHRRCMQRRRMRPTDDMRPMRGIVLGYIGEGEGEFDSEEA